MKNQQSNAIERALGWFEQNAAVDDQGRLKYGITVEYHVASEVLMSNASFPDDMPERTRRRLLLMALKRYLRYEKYRAQANKAAAFSDALMVGARALERAKSQFIVLMFLNIDKSALAALGELRLVGQTLESREWNDLADLELSELLEKVYRQDRDNPILWRAGEDHGVPNYSAFQPIEARLTTYGQEAAIEIASDLLDLFRALLNLPSVLGRFTYFRSRPAALSVFRPSPIYGIFKSNGSLEGVYLTTQSYDYAKKRLTDSQVKSVKYLLSKFGEHHPNSSSLGFMVRIFRQYQEALDTPEPQGGFLSLWQVLENLLSLRESRLKNKQILARISNLVKVDDQLRDLIVVLINRRNELVHSGVFPEKGDDSFFLLKMFVDAALRRMLTLSDTYSSVAELQEYLRLSTLGSTDLARKKRIIETILDARRIAQSNGQTNHSLHLD